MIFVPKDVEPVWGYYGDTILPSYVRGQGRWAAIFYVGQVYSTEPDPCPGEGRCHGCMTWCAWCGTVTDVCDADEWPARCDRHQRYPEKPEPPKPDPRQLFLPGFGVDAA